MFLTEIYRNKWVKLVLLAAALVIVGALFLRLSSVLSALMISLILAYLCDPLADFFERLRLSRTLSVAVVAFLVLGLLAILILLVIPLFAKELAELSSGFPAALERLQVKLIPKVQTILAKVGIPVPSTLEESIGYLKSHLPALQSISLRIFEPVYQAIRTTFSGLAGTIVGLLNLIIIPVAWFYLLRDFDKIKAHLADLIPQHRRALVTGYARRIDEVIGNFLQGQIIVAILLGLLYGLGLQFVAKVPLGFMLGFMAGLLSIIPYMGLLIGIVPAMVLALLAHGDWQHPMLVVAVFAVAQLLEGNLITPKIVGDKVGLNPVTIIFSLLIFGELLGLLGLLIAVPLTAVLMVFFQDGLKRYRESEFFKSGATPI